MVRGRTGDQVHRKIRDFLVIHRKSWGQCTVCGSKNTKMTANRRITTYCWLCQPGMLIRN